MNSIFITSFDLPANINLEVHLKKHLLDLTDLQIKKIYESFTGKIPDNLNDYSEEVGSTYRKYVMRRISQGIDSLIDNVYVHPCDDNTVYIVGGIDDSSWGMYDYYTAVALIDAGVI